jgi:hypothetical protein
LQFSYRHSVPWSEAGPDRPAAGRVNPTAYHTNATDSEVKRPKAEFAPTSQSTNKTITPVGPRGYAVFAAPRRMSPPRVRHQTFRPLLFAAVPGPPRTRLLPDDGRRRRARQPAQLATGPAQLEAGASPRAQAKPASDPAPAAAEPESDPVGDAIRTATGIAATGARVASGIGRELVRRLPRP